MLPTFTGKWLGGPHNSVIIIDIAQGNEVTGSYRCPSGAFAEFSGKLHRATHARCLWVDPDVAGAATRNVDQILELQLDPSGDSLSGTATTATGGSHSWSAKRVKPKARQPGEKLSTSGVCVNRDIFERLTRPKSAQSLDSEVRFRTLRAFMKVGCAWRVWQLCLAALPLLSVMRRI